MKVVKAEVVRGKLASVKMRKVMMMRVTAIR
jgi:hypothetical protein